MIKSEPAKVPRGGVVDHGLTLLPQRYGYLPGRRELGCHGQ